MLHAALILFLIVFAGGGCLSAFLAVAKPFSLQGFIQLGAGILITVTIAAEARTGPRCEFLLDALTAATLLISLTGFALYGQNSNESAGGLYHDPMLYGAVFTLLLPLMLAGSPIYFLMATPQAAHIEARLQTLTTTAARSSGKSASSFGSSSG